MARHEKDGQDETVLVEILSVHKAIECRERYRKFKRPVAGKGVTIRTPGAPSSRASLISWSISSR